MSGGFLYLDSSALVKLVLPEAETDALLELLHGREERVSSALAVVEVLRAARRASDSELVHWRACQAPDQRKRKELAHFKHRRQSARHQDVLETCPRADLSAAGCAE